MGAAIQNRWSDKEVDYILSNYEVKTIPEMAKELDRTQWSVYQKAHKMGLSVIMPNWKADLDTTPIDEPKKKEKWEPVYVFPSEPAKRYLFEVFNRDGVSFTKAIIRNETQADRLARYFGVGYTFKITPLNKNYKHFVVHS